MWVSDDVWYPGDPREDDSKIEDWYFCGQMYGPYSPIEFTKLMTELSADGGVVDIKLLEDFEDGTWGYQVETTFSGFQVADKWELNKNYKCEEY
jgi:uncharacterized protein YwgA